MESKSDLEKYIANLSEESGCKKILVIGGGGKQNGNISSSLEVLQTEYLDKYNCILNKFTGNIMSYDIIHDEKLY